MVQADDFQIGFTFRENYRNKNNILWPIYIIEKCLSRMRIDPEISKPEAMWKLTS